MAEFSLSTAAIVWIIIISLAAIAVFIASRYRKFKTNEFVIHLRNGKVRSAGRGGKIIKLPLIDEIIVIPTTTRKSLLNSSEKILSREYQDVKISSMLYWRVADPNVAFNSVSWDRHSSDYVENVLSTATEAIIRTTCAGLSIEKILTDRVEIIKMITDQLLNLTKDWGIIIESLEIIEVHVLDSELKNNMEAVKKIAEKQKAKLSEANAAEIYRLREIDVSRQADIAEKEMAIQVQQQEMKRMELEAESYRKAKLIKAQADAEAIRITKLAGLEAEAEGTKMKMMAEAEGFKKQVEAMNAADANFMAIKLIEKLPEIYSHLSPEHMFVMGEGTNGFSNLIQSIVPLMELLPEISKRMKTSMSEMKDYDNIPELLPESKEKPKLQPPEKNILPPVKTKN